MPKRTPSPEVYLPPSTSPTPDEKRSRHRQKAQPSQADAVLIGFLSNWNQPEITSRAGEEALTTDRFDVREPSAGRGSDTEMEVMVQQNIVHNLVRVAETASALVVDGEPKSGDPGALTASNLWRSDRSRRPSPRLDIKGSGRLSNGYAFSASNTTSRNQDRNEQLHPSPKPGNNFIATSPLQRYTISASEGSPLETLPAMQTSPALSSRSPNGQQSLPSIHAAVGHLADGRPPSAAAPLTIQNRQPYSANSAVHSPPHDYPTARPSPYPSLHARTSGSYPTSYPATEPSPASTNSAISPREPHHQRQNPRSMSPPQNFTSRQFHANGMTPSGEAQTPLSATTQPSMSTLSSECSPVSDRLMMDPDRMLPPLVANGPLINGGFQCEYSGCTAPPFQTQYLLNSHANVHSQNRPHYCPVKTCNRSEGGKGFKRKNEMIRHGLVHQSPGYICPFCPEREHKYPRPDNLQRHVRVHHVDRDKDDPQLREVLAQRPEGGSRGRRRRVNS